MFARTEPFLPCLRDPRGRGRGTTHVQTCGQQVWPVLSVPAGPGVLRGTRFSRGKSVLRARTGGWLSRHGDQAASYPSLPPLLSPLCAVQPQPLPETLLGHEASPGSFPRVYVARSVGTSLLSRDTFNG